MHDALIVTLSEIPNHVCGGMCQLDGVLVLMCGVAYMKGENIQPMCGGPGAGACRYNNDGYTLKYFRLFFVDMCDNLLSALLLFPTNDTVRNATIIKLYCTLQ